MKVKTRELEGVALDWAVAVAEGAENLRENPHRFDKRLIARLAGRTVYMKDFRFSTDWAQGGPIIEREITMMFKHLADGWTAQIRHEKEHPSLVKRKVTTGWTNASGPTPLIAALRCFVASKVGDEVEIPDILCNSYI